MTTPQAHVAGNLRTSVPFNEPVRDYRPGSPEATALLAEIDRVRGRVQDIPNVIDGEALPMHIAMLTKAGIRLMENVRMTDIVDDKVYEFLIIAAPLKIKGGTGSPVRLLALI